MLSNKPYIDDVPTAVYVCLKNLRMLADVAYTLADDPDIASGVIEDITTVIACIDDAITAVENNDELYMEEISQSRKARESQVGG